MGFIGFSKREKIAVENLKLQKDIEGLIKVLEQKKRKAGKAAATALIELVKPSIEKLIYLNELFAIYRYDEAFREVMHMLIDIGEPAVEPLIYVLKDKNKFFQARVAAVQILAEIGYKRARGTLVQILEDEEEDLSVRARIVYEIGRERDSDLLESLIQILKSAFTPKELRRGVVQALGEIGDKRAAKFLKLSLNADDELVRVFAKEALDKIG